jgi:xanthine dehydrogenase accessory factor
MTHDHALDEEVLVRLLRLPALPRFLGVIGSRSKRVRFAQRLEARGFAPSIIDKIRMPVGLDLGGRTAAEIAVAVTAELISVRYERHKVAT